MQNTFYHNQRKNNGAIKKFTIDLQKFTTANESIPWHIETDIILKYNLSLICNFYIQKMQYCAGCRVNIYQKLREVHHLFVCCYGTIWRQENVLGTCRTINAIFWF